jgi:hypothetical protein
VLGQSPGQARAHTSEVGVGVRVGRASTTGRGIVRPAASALAGPRLLSWAVREWEMAVGSGSASDRVSAHNQC